MANILAAKSAETRAKGEAMIQQADRLLCESWNERMWSDGEAFSWEGMVKLYRRADHHDVGGKELVENRRRKGRSESGPFLVTSSGCRS